MVNWVVRHSATSAAAQQNNAVRRLNMLRGHFLTTKVMGSITFLCLKPQQTTGLSMITCQGYSWKQNTHQGSAPWMIPPVSRNSQENLLWLRNAWKTIWSKERLAKTSAEASKTYQEYDWNATFKDGSLSKQTIKNYWMRFYPCDRVILIVP